MQDNHAPLRHIDHAPAHPGSRYVILVVGMLAIGFPNPVGVRFFA